MSKNTTVSLGKALDIAHGANMKERLVAALKKKSRIVLVADKIEKVDTAGLQLLYAFKLEVETLNKQLAWQKPSIAFKNACQSLGMTEALDL